MNNIQITNIKPKSKGTYIEYTAVLKPTDHTINGNFTALKNEIGDAFESSNWLGFKKLIIKRIIDDCNNVIKEK